VLDFLGVTLKKINAITILGKRPIPHGLPKRNKY
jgi:hypothetical protein